MVEGLPNNPRGFAETIALEVWRTPFDGDKGTADLHVDVVFGEGRVVNADSSLRYRLRLRKAEVRILRDATQTLQFLPETLSRTTISTTEIASTTKVSTKAKLAGKGTLSGSLQGTGAASMKVDAEASAEANAERIDDEEYVTRTKLGPMKFQHRAIEGGYAFEIVPTAKLSSLDGQPWDPLSRRVTIADTKHPRSRGEPPEPRVELRCRREDLIIEDIQFGKKKAGFFERLPAGKKVAVEAYIRDQVAKLGVDVGDLSQPFTEILLMDAGPEERRSRV